MVDDEPGCETSILITSTYSIEYPPILIVPYKLRDSVLMIHRLQALPWTLLPSTVLDAVRNKAQKECLDVFTPSHS
jgi:hypothetical protein